MVMFGFYTDYANGWVIENEQEIYLHLNRMGWIRPNAFSRMLDLGLYDCAGTSMPPIAQRVMDLI